MRTQLINPSTKLSEVVITSSYRTAGRDSTARRLMAVLENSPLVQSDPQWGNLSSLFVMWIVCTDNMEFGDQLSPAIEALHTLWMRVEQARSGSYQVDPEQIEAVFQLFVDSVSIDLFYSTLLPAMRSAQVLYPASAEFKPAAELTEEEQGDPTLEKKG